MDLRATRVEINIKNFRNNIKIFRDKIGSSCSLCLSVKGNAYGHGIIAMAHHAKDIVDFFAVATVNEGASLRESGINLPILVLSSHLESEIPTICNYGLSPLVSHCQFFDKYEYWANYYNINLALHIKVDTGMSRAGILPNDVLSSAKKIMAFKNIHIEGLCTHLACSDDREVGADFTEKQISLFENIIDEFKNNNINPKYIHAANSSAVMYYKNSHFNMVRFGLGAYGYSDDINIKPVMEFKTKITIIKNISKDSMVSYGCTWKANQDTTIGIAPVGYADGYMRSLSNKASVLIDGDFYNVIGRVCMDQIIIELPYGFNQLEHDVLLFGDNEKLNANTLSILANTISYEILTSISDRVPRIYKS